MPRCVGIKTTGTQCTHNPPDARCRIHQRPLTDNGPNHTALCELEYIMKNSRGHVGLQIMLQVASAEVPHFPNAQNFPPWHDMTQEQQEIYHKQNRMMSIVVDRVVRASTGWHMDRITALEQEYRNAPPLTLVNLTHLIDELREEVCRLTRNALAEIRMARGFAEFFGDEPLPPPARNVRRVANGGVDRMNAEVAINRAIGAIEILERELADPDHIGLRIAILTRRATLAIEIARNAAFIAQIQLPPLNLPQIPGVADPPDVPRPPPRELEVFAKDKQNVHTRQSVQMTKDVVARVLKIAVPEEYRWNSRIVSKTPGEIITECRLSPNSVAQFVTRYLQNENIYEMGVGIYGKVLDGVWHYVRNSEHKDELCKILRQELQDNIGMCLQGNLSRLCNVLAGYMEGIGPQESPAERLGREMPKLMEIEDSEARMNTARGVLRDVGLPEDEWPPWLEALE